MVSACSPYNSLVVYLVGEQVLPVQPSVPDSDEEVSVSIAEEVFDDRGPTFADTLETHKGLAR